MVTYSAPLPVTRDRSGLTSGNGHREDLRETLAESRNPLETPDRLFPLGYNAGASGAAEAVSNRLCVCVYVRGAKPRALELCRLTAAADKACRGYEPGVPVAISIAAIASARPMENASGIRVTYIDGSFDYLDCPFREFTAWWEGGVHRG